MNGLIDHIFHNNRVRILYHFRHIARYWSKIANVSYTTCARDSAVEHTPSEFRSYVHCEETKVLIQLDSETSFMMCNCLTLRCRHNV